MILRLPTCVVLVAAAVFGQTSDPAYEPLSQAYASLRGADYDSAISSFRKALQMAPARAATHKDLAYTYLKIGENDLARDHFQQAMELDPSDHQAAREYAFVAYETKRQAEARLIFDRLRKTGDSAAEQAFQNIDRPLAEGIARWQKAIDLGADDFSAHFELATLADQRGELDLAAQHFELAWRRLPDRRSVLVDLGRVWKAMARVEDATAALLAASRGGEARAAELARELLPDHYPYVSEFQAALKLDPQNAALRRELAFLLLRMDRAADAEEHLWILTQQDPGDLLAATQLGFLLYARGESDDAMALFDRVLAGSDEELANRVRAVLRLPQTFQSHVDAEPNSLDARIMAERSIQAGFLNDALKYLQRAHEADPADFQVMLQLGWTHNLLHQDSQAVRWFDLARNSPDPLIANEAARAAKGLHDDARRFRTTAWLYPIFSTRWHDLFSYAQVKTELRVGSFLRPYASVRFVGDTRQTIGSLMPLYLSENSFVVAGGVRTMPWHGLTGWFEAGTAANYVTGHMLPDYRGGISGFLQKLPESSGWFMDSTFDALFISRYGNDFLAYDQSRFGYAASRHIQLYVNADVTVDGRRQGWANFAETGPGIRCSAPWLPRGMWVSASLIRGTYLITHATFTDVRIGAWYAFTR